MQNSAPKRLFFAALRLAMVSTLAVTATMFAQSVSSTISGVVTDPSGAVIKDASVEAKNASTDAARTAKTDGQGFYTILNLEPGTYQVTASQTGFSSAETKSIQLLAREQGRVDLRLEVAGSAKTVIEVTAVPVVSEQLTQSDSKSGALINSLALNFRATPAPSPIQVANLAPTVSSDRGGNITVAGQLPTATSFSLDGISTQLVRNGGPTRDLFPSVEGIAEFRVNSSGNSAEFSQPTDITVITKSGTNDLHGGGFWYFQRKDWNSDDQISKQNPTGSADTFGASLAGPLFIPKIYNGRNKTFFFFDYEGVRLDQNTILQYNTPPAAWRTGDFSGSGGTVVDPLTGMPFPGNRIPTNRISPTSTKALGYFFPVANRPGNDLSSNNFVQSFPGTYVVDGYDGRFDHAFSDRHQVWVRVTQKNIVLSGTDSATGNTTYNPTQGAYNTTSDLTNIAASYNWVIRPNLINEFRGGYTRGDFGFSYPQATQGDKILADLGITGLPGSPRNGLGGVPAFYIGDLVGGVTTSGHPRVQKNGTLQFSDNVSWNYGKNNFKFGSEWRRLNYQDNITFLNGDEYGDYIFTGDFTAGGRPKNSNVNSFADFLLGYVADAQQAQNGPDGKPYGYHWGVFFQDEWRVRPNLTITAGLRYEINTPFNDETNQLGQFDRSFPGGRLITQGTKGLALTNPLWRQAVGNTPFVTNRDVGLPITLRNTYYHNIQPRLGISYSPDSKTTIRASGGIYSVPVLGAVLYSLLGVNTSYFADYPSSATAVRTFPNVFTGANAPQSYPSYRRANNIDLKDPRVIQWNFSIDRNIGWSTLARFAYTGSHTYNLIYSPDLNQVQPNTVGYSALTATPALRQQNLRYPNFSEILTRDNGPSAKYNALTLELNKRFSNDLSFQNNYTYTRNFTNALGTAPNSAVPVGGQTDNGGNVNNYYNIAADEGNAYYNPRHRFVSTFVYQLPFGKGKRFLNSTNRLTNLAIGGWSVTGVALAQSGFFLTPFFNSSQADPSGTNPSQRSVRQQRPDCVPGKTGNLANPTNTTYFDRSAFVIPQSNIGRFGNCGVGNLEGPGTGTFSMSAGKSLAITERISLRYEAQFSNLFDFVNRDVPNVNLSSGSFGRITQSQQTQQAGPRNIQMQVRLQF